MGDNLSNKGGTDSERPNDSADVPIEVLRKRTLATMRDNSPTLSADEITKMVEGSSESMLEYLLHSQLF